MPMTRFRCGNCNYTFAPKIKGKVPSKCPYCSTDGRILEEDSSVERMDTDFEEM